jgi:hypothetical protein
MVVDMILPSFALCNEPSAATAGRFTQDTEIPVPAQRFGGVVEGVVLAVGKRHRSMQLKKRD